MIASAVRTPIGKLSGALADLRAPQLGSIALRAALERAHVKADEVDEVIMGNVLQAGVGQNPARQAALGAGFPVSIAAYTVNKVCGSSLKAVMLAAQAIKAGDAKIIAAGGQESMTNAPYLLLQGRQGYRLGNGTVVDALVHDGLWDVYNNEHMGNTGETVAQRYHVTREDADRFAVRSHKRAMEAINGGAFRDETVPVEIPQKKGPPIRVEKDEGVRADSTVEGLAKLRPSFVPTGIVTAGNASQISDGGSAILVMSAAEAKRRGVQPLARIVDYTTAGVKPEWVMEAPIPGVRALLQKTGKTIDDVGRFEHNEAFASASCAVMKELHVPDDRFNVHGGAVALGHPIGASGGRVLATLLHEMRRSKKDRGIATLCLGGGNAVSMMVERV